MPSQDPLPVHQALGQSHPSSLFLIISLFYLELSFCNLFEFAKSIFLDYELLDVLSPKKSGNKNNKNINAIRTTKLRIK